MSSTPLRSRRPSRANPMAIRPFEEWLARSQVAEDGEHPVIEDRMDFSAMSPTNHLACSYASVWQPTHAVRSSTTMPRWIHRGRSVRRSKRDRALPHDVLHRLAEPEVGAGGAMPPIRRAGFVVPRSCRESSTAGGAALNAAAGLPGEIGRPEVDRPALREPASPKVLIPAIRTCCHKYKLELGAQS